MEDEIGYIYIPKRTVILSDGTFSEQFADKVPHFSLSKSENPELIVIDAVAEFNLNEEQAEKLRKILMYRGVNKWLYARRLLIDFKHKVKEVLREESQKSNNKEKINLLQWINAGLQNIAKQPRWIEWPQTVTHDWDKIERDIIIKGKKC